MACPTASARSVRRAVERTALHQKALDPVATLSRGYPWRYEVAHKQLARIEDSAPQKLLAGESSAGDGAPSGPS